MKKWIFKRLYSGFEIVALWITLFLMFNTDIGGWAVLVLLSSMVIQVAVEISDPNLLKK